jgi:branched-subunit amino acid ABC-type transport system permease component
VEFLVVSVLNGVIHGLLLFMVSAGLTLIFGMMGVLNFAHAWFYLLGAHIGFPPTPLAGRAGSPPRSSSALRRWSNGTAAPRASIRPHP